MSRMCEWLDKDNWDEAFPQVAVRKPEPLEQMELWPEMFPPVPQRA